MRTWEGFVYLATITGYCAKKAIGYAMGDHMRTTLLRDAIDMAVCNCPHEEGETVFHSDRNFQYTSEQLCQHLKSHRIIASTGRTGYTVTMPRRSHSTPP